jgi:hypothetical protein
MSGTQPPRKRSRKSQAPPRPARQSHIPQEVFALVAARVAPRQSSLWVFSMVCRGAREAVLGSNPQAHALWLKILTDTEVYHFEHFSLLSAGPPVVRGVPMGPYPNFKVVEGCLAAQRWMAPTGWFRQQFTWPHMDNPELRPQAPFTQPEVEELAKFAVHRSRILNTFCCGYCGSRTDLVRVWGLGRRACSACLKHNLVSAAALLAEYGFDYSARMAELAGRVFFFRIRDSRFVFHHLSHNPVDFTPQAKACQRSHTFFWRPHLEKIVDLPALKREHRDRARAIAPIQAAARALCVRVALLQRGRPAFSSSSHMVFVRAGPKPERFPDSYVGFYSDEPCTEEQVELVKNFLPHCNRTRLATDREREARAVLQKAFLAFRGRIMLPYAKNPKKALERLRMAEAVRQEGLVPALRFAAEDGALFRKWRDMAPVV